MENRVIRKSVLTAPSLQDQIDAYLLKLRQSRRRIGERAPSFNSFANEAMAEKLSREDA